MSSGYFKLKSKNKLVDMEIGQVLQTSDYATLTPEGVFVQMEYIETDDVEKKVTHVKPGIFAMKTSMAEMYLIDTEFNNDRILQDFVETNHIEQKVDKFFQKVNVYKELEIENIKRAALIYGPPGSGKSTILNKISKKYGSDSKTMVLVWHTDVFEPMDVKNFVQSFEYSKYGVERMIFIVEDIGGTTIEQSGGRRPSDSSLLSLLDNKEKTFRVPVFILATTNNPEMFQENITDRPERFDDKIEAGHPNSKARIALLNFFSKGVNPEEEALKLMASSKCDKLSPAHIREVVIRSRLYDKTQLEVINELLNESKKYQTGFTKHSGNTGIRDY